jgi:uncharacterized protein (DUF2235 family)
VAGRIVAVFLDGTGNQLRAKGNTNVLRLYQMLDLSDPSKQIAYYDPGVGTFGAQGAWTPLGQSVSKLAGLAFGLGLRANLAEAYMYLMQHYRPGDRLLIFGFSRGAYCARALAGLLQAVGLIRPGSENLVPYAIGVYARNGDLSDDDWSQIHRFAATFCTPVDGRTAIPVEFVGIWDSVKAAGFLGWELHWLYTRQLPNVRVVRHAVSIDEKRRPYREYPVRPRNGKPPPDLDETWFAGVHSDVGGTFDDDPRLSTIALRWVSAGAVDAGLILKDGAFRKACPVTVDDALGTVHRMGWIWALLTYRRRRIPSGARVHASVRDRIAAQPNYARTLPDTVTWADPGWSTPDRPLGLHPG